MTRFNRPLPESLDDRIKRSRIFPFRLYEKVCASLLLAGIVTGTGFGLFKGLTPTPTENPENDLRVCVEVWVAPFPIDWTVKCWDLNKPRNPPPPAPPAEPPVPCPPPPPDTCDPNGACS